jgi:hypothetical protein
LLPATDDTFGIGTNTAAWKYAHINLVVGDLRGNINPIYNLNSEISTYNTVQLIKDKLVEIWSTSGNGVGANV